VAQIVAIPSVVQAYSSLEAVEQVITRLDFPLKVLGRSDAPIVPCRVGDWWMEPLNLFTKLSPRASQRLDAVLALGITPRAVVLFHEIVPIDPPLPAANPFSTHASRWAAAVGAALLQAARVLGPLTSRGAAAGVAWAARTVRAIRTWFKGMPDPVLVIVTGDGYWVEIDRWYADGSEE
jgi:hypothetical protein